MKNFWRVCLKKPWYIWLSIFGFMYLWSKTSSQFKFHSKSLKDKSGKPIHYMALWPEAVGNMLLSGLIVLMPSVAFSVIFSGIASSISSFAETVFNYLLFVVLYFSGVWAANRHDKWRKKHLYSRSDSEC